MLTICVTKEVLGIFLFRSLCKLVKFISPVESIFEFLVASDFNAIGMHSTTPNPFGFFVCSEDLLVLASRIFSFCCWHFFSADCSAYYSSEIKSKDLVCICCRFFLLIFNWNGIMWERMDASFFEMTNERAAFDYLPFQPNNQSIAACGHFFFALIYYALLCFVSLRFALVIRHSSNTLWLLQCTRVL